MTLSEFKRTVTRHPHAATFGNEPPPTLAELLELDARQTPLALELKDDRFLQERDAEKFFDVLARHNALERVVLVSFNVARLQSCRRVSPGTPTGAITLRNPLPLYPTELLGPLFPLLYVNPLYVAWARRLGKIVCPLDISPEPRLRYYRFLGLPVIMTNHPARTIRAMRAVWQEAGS
jgi:glycerophosphoryl diester phosphodiesterase